MFVFETHSFRLLLGDYQLFVFMCVRLFVCVCVCVANSLGILSECGHIMRSCVCVCACVCVFMSVFCI